MSASSLLTADVIDLVDDDILSESDSTADVFLITQDSLHTFPNYQAIHDFLDQYAARSGFEIRLPHNKGVADQPGHSGTAACWCYLDAPVTLKPEEQQLPSHLPPRTVVPRAANRSGHQQKCGCKWRVNFNRRRTGEYALTSRSLEHTGHECVPAQQLATTIDSLRCVPEQVERSVRNAIKTGNRGVESLRRFIAEEHQVDLDRKMFRNLVQRTSASLGIKDAYADFTALVAWLQQEITGGRAVARIKIEDGTTVSGVYYASTEMLHHCRRNSQVLLMDTTFSTNRFSWPLCLLCAVDEHYHTVLLGIAVLHYQTTDSFEWVLHQLKSTVPEEAWAAVASVFTDGDQAMAAALTSTIPHSQHLRCRYHLKQNLRSKLHKLGTDPITADACVKQWESAAGCEKESDFDVAIAAFLTSNPRVAPYFTATFPPARCYADFALNHITTFGSRTTARVESWNAQLKGMLDISSRTSLQILFESLRHAMSEKDGRGYKIALSNAALRPVVTLARTIDAETAPHLTYYAQSVVRKQADLMACYDLKMVQPPMPAIFSVFDRRASAAIADSRQVTLTETTMHCTCGFPTAYLLPCRHVLVVNNHMYCTPFRVQQVGKRWLRAYMPAARHPLPANQEVCEPFDTAVPSFSSASSSPSASISRGHRFGQITGWLETLRSMAVEGEYFAAISKDVQALCSKWERVVRQPSAAMIFSTRPQAAVSSPSGAQPALQPTIDVQQMHIPGHKKRSRGKASESRQQCAAEQADKQARVSASQSM